MTEPNKEQEVECQECGDPMSPDEVFITSTGRELCYECYADDDEV